MLFDVQQQIAQQIWLELHVSLPQGNAVGIVRQW
jgi:hypothetical protein